MKTVMKRLRRLRLRWFERISPFRVLQDWAWDGWDQNGWHPTWRTRIAFPVIGVTQRLGAVGRCLFLSTKNSELEEYQLHAQVAYRVKAIICLVLGIWARDDERIHTIEVAWWNERRTSYEYEEYDSDRVSVGTGWRNWFVELESEGVW